MASKQEVRIDATHLTFVRYQAMLTGKSIESIVSEALEQYTEASGSSEIFEAEKGAKLPSTIAASNNDEDAHVAWEQMLKNMEALVKSKIQRKVTAKSKPQLQPEELTDILAQIHEDSGREADLLFGKCEGSGDDGCGCRTCDPPEDESAIIFSDIPFEEQVETLRLLRDRKKYSPAVVVSDAVN